MKYKHPPIIPGQRPTSQFLLDLLIRQGPVFWNWTVLPLLPAVALGYCLLVALFLVGWHEGTFQQHIPALAGRCVVLLISLIIAKVITDLKMPMTFSTVPLFMWISMLSVWCITRTRVRAVEGGEEPKLKKFCMRGKLVLVTGANTGIGLETVRRLVKEGARVIMACRSQEKAHEAMEDIKEYHFKRRLLIEDSQLMFLSLDLADFDSVRKAAKTVLDMKLPLYCLINNAGIMMAEKKLSKDGNELCMQANHLGHYLLTRLLLSNLQETPGARVLNVTSSTYALANKGVDLDDLMCDKTRQYTLFGQYAQSKLANILFTKELAKRHDKLRCYAIHPGLVRTDVVRNMPPLLYYPNLVFGLVLATLQKKPEQGAYTSIWAACTDHPPINGSYLVNSKVAATNACATDEVQAAKLWDVSETLVGIKK
jgi:NAD(P)-dependent dehydrogenase (short-subunit alcohol dehydrogenase family)